VRYSKPDTLKLDMPDTAGGSFVKAKGLAEAEAQKAAGPVMLLSWKDNRTGASSPDVESCTCGIEGWEQYALSRGAELRVEVGRDYVFYFKAL